MGYTHIHFSGLPRDPLIPLIEHGIDLCDGAALNLEILLQEGKSNEIESSHILYLAGQFVIASSRLSKVLDPKTGKPSAIEMRTKGLAALLGAANLFEGLSTVRNRVEHMDEDLDSYLENGDKLHWDIICCQSSGPPPKEVFRMLETSTFKYYQFGRCICLLEVVRDLIAFADCVATLKSNQPEANPDRARKLGLRLRSSFDLMADIQKGPTTAGYPAFDRSIVTAR